MAVVSARGGYAAFARLYSRLFRLVYCEVDNGKVYERRPFVDDVLDDFVSLRVPVRAGVFVSWRSLKKDYLRLCVSEFSYLHKLYIKKAALQIRFF